jgi:hypothetical protein
MLGQRHRAGASVRIPERGCELLSAGEIADQRPAAARGSRGRQRGGDRGLAGPAFAG